MIIISKCGIFDFLMSQYIHVVSLTMLHLMNIWLSSGLHWPTLLEMRVLWPLSKNPYGSFAKPGVLLTT